MRPGALLPAGIFAILAVVFGVYLYQVGAGGKNIAEIPSVLIDKPALALDLPPIEGRTDGLASARLKGSVSLVNVFASWCLPCRIEHPQLMRLARDGFAVYGLNYKDDPDDARRFLAEFGNPYRAIGADTTGRAVIDWGVYGVPETFVIDRAGRIRFKHVGPITPHDLEAKIRPILDELAK